MKQLKHARLMAAEMEPRRWYSRRLNSRSDYLILRSAQGLLRFVRLLGRMVNRHGLLRPASNGKALNCCWVCLSGNRPFGGRSSICPGTEFDDGKPDGMIVGQENQQVEAPLWVGKEAKGLNSWFVPITGTKRNRPCADPILKDFWCKRGTHPPHQSRPTARRKQPPAGFKLTTPVAPPCPARFASRCNSARPAAQNGAATAAWLRATARPRAPPG